MQYLDKLVDHLISTARAEEVRKREENTPYTLNNFKVTKFARDLVASAQSCAKHHREREKFYTKELELAEIQLRERGITMEVIDPSTGHGFVSAQTICSGALSYGQTGSLASSVNTMPKFQPRVDQVLLGDVERAKKKMLEHGNKAIQFEKYARAFSCCDAKTEIQLTVDDIHLFRLRF